MSERAALQRQIEELDRKVRELQERIDERNVLSIRPQVWLAQTVGEVLTDAPESREKEYPTGASAAFGIKFRHPKFEEKIGSATQGDLRPALKGEFGSDKPQRYAMTVPQTYIREGTDVFVVEIDGQFYFLQGASKSAYIVALDNDLKPASNQQSETVESSSTGVNTDLSCVRASHSDATIWGFNENGLLCPTDGRLESPEGIYNFQIDQTIAAKKSSGDPNLILVYREADSGRYVPECPTCGTTVPRVTVGCDCLNDTAICRVLVQIGSMATLDRFGDVRRVQPDRDFSGQVWPDYCLFNINDEPLIHDHIPCSSCGLWNRPLGFELAPSQDPTDEAQCDWGVKQFGCSFNAQGAFGANLCERLPKPFDETEDFPCTPRQNYDAYGIFAYFSCPPTPDGTGTAEVDIWIDGCLFLKVYIDNVVYQGGLQTDIIDNRLSRVQIIEQSRCVCLFDNTRNDNGQGNFNASTSTPDLQDGVPLGEVACLTPTAGDRCPCHNYNVNVAGTHDFDTAGAGRSVALEVNDLVIYDDTPGIQMWVVVKNEGGAENRKEFLPCEVTNLIDSDGCDWSQTVREAAIELLFHDCP